MQLSCTASGTSFMNLSQATTPKFCSLGKVDGFGLRPKPMQVVWAADEPGLKAP